MSGASARINICSAEQGGMYSRWFSLRIAKVKSILPRKSFSFPNEKFGAAVLVSKIAKSWSGLITGFCPREIFLRPDLIPNLRNPLLHAWLSSKHLFQWKTLYLCYFLLPMASASMWDLCSKFLAGSALDQHFLGAFALECR